MTQAERYDDECQEPIPISRRQRIYDEVNETWQKTSKVPLTEEAAIRVLRKLSRHFKVGLHCKPENHRFVPRNPTNLYLGVVNVNRGWASLIHHFSHYLWYYRKPAGERNHTKEHGRWERRVTKYVIARGWLSGKLDDPPKVSKPEPTVSEVRSEKIDRRREQIARLERKIKTLTTRLRTAKRSLAALERNAGLASLPTNGPNRIKKTHLQNPRHGTSWSGGPCRGLVVNSSSRPTAF